MRYPMERATDIKRKVLVVDDDLSVCQLLKDALRREGYEATTCNHPKEALELAGKEEFGLIFVDIRLPEMSGFELASVLKEKDAEREVVFITGYGSFESVLQAIKIGAYDYLRKPFNLSELNLCLRRYQERQELKEKIRSAERRYFDLVQNIPLLIWGLGPDLELEFINDACKGILGYSTREALATPGWFLERIHPDDRKETLKRLKSGFNSKAAPFSVECRLVHKEGHNIHTILKSLPHGDSEFDGKRDRLEGVIVDITDRVLLEKAIVQREKLKTLGAISAEVAHEIRNPLVSIGGFAQRLKKKQPDLAEGEIILKESKRLERILDRIRDYLKPVDIRPRLCSVNELVNYCTELLKIEFEQRQAKCSLELKKSIPLIQADPDILTQILITLIRTALESMAEGETLAIKSLESDRNVQVTLRNRVPASKFKNPEELLLPFDEEGESLGLPLCYKLLRKMGGILSCEREPNELVFIASLPKRGDTETAANGKAQ
jgi:PAS domain S-box-containing protein